MGVGHIFNISGQQQKTSISDKIIESIADGCYPSSVFEEPVNSRIFNVTGPIILKTRAYGYEFRYSGTWDPSTEKYPEAKYIEPDPHKWAWRITKTDEFDGISWVEGNYLVWTDCKPDSFTAEKAYLPHVLRHLVWTGSDWDSNRYGSWAQIGEVLEKEVRGEYSRIFVDLYDNGMVHPSVEYTSGGIGTYNSDPHLVLTKDGYLNCIVKSIWGYDDGDPVIPGEYGWYWLMKSKDGINWSEPQEFFRFNYRTGGLKGEKFDPVSPSVIEDEGYHWYALNNPLDSDFPGRRYLIKTYTKEFGGLPPNRDGWEELGIENDPLPWDNEIYHFTANKIGDLWIILAVSGPRKPTNIYIGWSYDGLNFRFQDTPIMEGSLHRSPNPFVSYLDISKNKILLDIWFIKKIEGVPVNFSVCKGEFLINLNH